ncbi:MAG: LCP family protein [Cellulomonas sp.]|uniref:LCP family protein n=1 Tax=Cellulomonas sp. TaxID=40001 RepID=UPI0017E1E263|nr:LCP family protein [Cellulomonas sp.]NMM17444.1 LCP family protein [Cellulomonas sp.]NMM30074.1 LCP family protein [Cellulomonas sp.]
MTTHHAAAPGPRTARHSRSVRTHHALRGVALVVTAVLAFGIAGVASAYTRLQGNIESADVTSLLGDRPTKAPPANPNDPNAGKAVNILLIGSDVRTGDNGTIGGVVSGMRSDTAIVLHISADRSRIEAVSIPRDSLVKIPACQRSDGSTSKAQTGMFNAAFSFGSESGKVSDAAACTMKTVEQTTGVFIDHYVVIDFAGFITMVNALGGVPICVPNALDSPDAGLHVSAGFQTLDGPTALAFARARKGAGLGDGSDTGRIVRQQKLLAATVKTARSKNLLTDIPELVRFLNAATSSITTDPDLASIPSMSGLAFSVKNTRDIQFMTIPFGPAPSDPNRVVWTKAADPIWANIAKDVPMLGTVTPAATAGTTTTPSAATAPSTTSSTTPTTTKTVPAPTTKTVPAPAATTQTAGTITPDDATPACA